MELETALKAYKEQIVYETREEKILGTIHKSKEIFILREQEKGSCYLEFLLGQYRFIRKRWWLLQMLLLGMSAVVLPFMENKYFITRSLGIIGVLFIVLIIPEFWKNKSNDCIQIEGTCLFAMRQIYASRMFMFGMFDLFILSCFCILAKGILGFAAAEILVQFLFPMLVAACICFGTLCSRTLMNESTAILLCLFWSAIWCVFVINETVYKAITLPAWCILFGAAAAFLIGAAYRVIQDCNGIWEVEISGVANN